MGALLKFIGAFVVNVLISTAISFAFQLAGASPWVVGCVYGCVTSLLWLAYWALEL